MEDIFDTIEAARITPDGKACVRKARDIAAWAEGEEKPAAKVELLAEARQWLRLGLEHDKATDSKLLREINEKLEKKDARRRKLHEVKAKQAGAPKAGDGAA
jgi:hypothetical protein